MQFPLTPTETLRKTENSLLAAALQATATIIKMIQTKTNQEIIPPLQLLKPPEPPRKMFLIQNLPAQQNLREMIQFLKLQLQASR